MLKSEEIKVPCRISRSGFPSERVFRVDLTGGAIYTGAAPLDYFWRDEAAPLGADVPAVGKTVDGLISGRILSGIGSGRLVISIPSGDVLSIAEDRIRELA